MALLQNVANEYAGKNGYTMVNFIGNGAFKEVYRISMKDGITRVLKLSDASKCNVDRTEREISSLLKCNDPRIARVYEHGIFDYNRGKYIYFIEEYLDGGILTAKMASNKIPIETILTDGKEMVKALAHLKELNLVHRDIKPDNIMFRKEINQPVFTDLGLVRDLKNISLTPSRVDQGPGTPYYSAPEQLNNDKAMVDWRTDQFSIGVVVGIWLTGQHPFQSKGISTYQVVERVANREHISTEFVQKIGKLGLSKITQMVEPWPIRRYQSIEELEMCFSGR